MVPRNNRCSLSQNSSTSSETNEHDLPPTHGELRVVVVVITFHLKVLLSCNVTCTFHKREEAHTDTRKMGV